MQLVNFTLVVEKAIEKWNETFKNRRSLVGLTIILTYDPNHFQTIKKYLSNIQIYAKTKNFEMSLDFLDNRLLITNL
ncbi:hypothetical protein D3C87_1546660 [compost metagenome]